MKEIRKHLGNLQTETQKLSKCVTESDEFVAVEDIQKAIKTLEFKIYEARETFERTKDLEEQ